MKCDQQTRTWFSEEYPKFGWILELNDGTLCFEKFNLNQIELLTLFSIRGRNQIGGVVPPVEQVRANAEGRSSASGLDPGPGLIG